MPEKVVEIAKHLPIASDQFEVGQDVRVSFIGGPFVPGRISKVLRAGPVLEEADGTETVIPIDDIEDKATLVFLSTSVGGR